MRPERVIVTSSAVREMIRELYSLPNTSESFVNVNSTVDPNASATDVEHNNFKPQSKIELDAMVKNIVANVVDKDVPEVYDAFMDAIQTIEKKNEREEAMTVDEKNSKIEETIRSNIRKFLAEVKPQAKKVKWSDPALTSVDPADIAANEEEHPEKRSMSTVGDVGGTPLDVIAKQMGLSVAGAKRLVDYAIGKARFLQTSLEDDERDIMVLTAMKDYIKFLKSSGALEPEDITLLNTNPKIVANLDGFRDFLDKHVKRAMRAAGYKIFEGKTLKERYEIRKSEKNAK